MQLIIAEKPSLAQAIAAILPGKKEKKSGYIEAGNIRVTWCVGHILEQAMPDHYLPESVPKNSKGSNGPFWACSNYKNEATPCKATFPDKGNQPDMAKKANSETVACPTCGTGQLRRLPSKKDPKKFFWSCSNYRNTEKQCTAIFFDKAGKPDFSPKEKRVA